MKKLLALILAMVMVLGITACGKTEPTDGETDTTLQTENVFEEDKNETEETQKEDEEVKDDKKEESKKEETKPAEKPADTKPAEKPAETKPAEKPAEVKPVEKPADTKPEEKPAETKPVEKPAETPKTVGNNLLSVFKANSSGTAISVAEKIVEKGNLPFMAGAMEVEPGLLPGFDNAEIKGFKSGAQFGPMMGSIAFVGYVFELENNVSASDFIANLKKNANLRWNICVEAEEMVTGSAGNKVFFVMCPKAFEE